jgi:tetratricopeptide (TPR) repeat protein
MMCARSRLYTSLIFIPAIIFAGAQKNLKADSLLKLLPAKSDSDYITLYVKIAEALTETRQLKLSFRYADSALQRAKSSGMPKLEAYVYTSTGRLYNYMNDFNKALDCYEQALKIHRVEKSPSDEISTLVNKGNTYFRTYEYQRAQKCYKEALHTYTKDPTGERTLADIYNNLGSTSGILGNYDEAREYFSRSMRIYEKANDNYSIAYCLNNLGTVEYSRKNYAGAREYLQKALDMKLIYSNNQDIAGGYRRLAEVDYSMQQYTRALQLLEKSLPYLDTSVYNDELREVYDQLAACYEKLNRMGEANRYNKLMKEINEEIFKKEMAEEIAQKDAMFEFSKAHIQDSLIQASKISSQQQDIKRSATIRWFLIVIVVIVLISLALIWKRYKISQAQQVEITRQKQLIANKQKEVMDSIRYARRIQVALITSEMYIEKALKRLNAR